MANILLNDRAAWASRWVWRWPLMMVGMLVTVAVLAADATLSWDSLSGEQQYILARHRSRWEQIDINARRALLERAANFKLHIAARKPSAGVVTNKAASKPDTAPTLRDRPQRRGALTAAQASLSVHSFRLRRVLRDLSGLSAVERRDLFERWAELSNSERIALVDRYSRNVADEEEIALQKKLREGKISSEQLQRGLSTGKLRGVDLKAALSAGKLSTHAIQDGIASGKIYAEDLEKVLRGSNIESRDLSNAIEHNRLPEGTTRASVAAPDAATPSAP